MIITSLEAASMYDEWLAIDQCEQWHRFSSHYAEPVSSHSDIIKEIATHSCGGKRSLKVYKNATAASIVISCVSNLVSMTPLS